MRNTRAVSAPAWRRGQTLRLEGVRVRRGSAEILRGVDLAFEPGERYVLVGASGAGKSTLLRLLNRLEDPAEGEIRCGDMPLGAMPVPEVRRRVGLVFQAPRPLPGSAAENLAYPFVTRGLPIPGHEAMVASLEELGLEASTLDRDASGLSGGERQRLAIAVALGIGPEILALDEPTSALDPASARRVIDALDRRAREDGLRTIVATHHRDHARRLGGRAVVMEAGRVVAVGPTGEILDRVDATVWGEAGEGGG